MRPRLIVALLALLAICLLASGCGGTGSGAAATAKGQRPSGEEVTIKVPGDAPTISDAVRLARPGDLVLVARGTYRETVTIKTARVTLRGESRDGVVVDGELRRGNGIVVTAPGVAVQNLTVRRNVQNGVLVTGDPKAASETPGEGGYDRSDAKNVRMLDSFLVSHVTAVNNGLYGIYAFSARNGTIERSYASGGADSGLYVGQCKPCNVVVRDNIAERNAVGYEGTNASDGMYVVRNRLVGNRVGLTTNSDYLERLAPQHQAVVAGNLVAGNDERQTPAQADGAFGIGLGIAGGTSNTVVRNRIVGNGTAGAVLASTEDLAPIDNELVGNVFGAQDHDVVFAATDHAPGKGNCLKGNKLRKTQPAGLATSAKCPAAKGKSPSAAMPNYRAPDGIPFSQVQLPPAQPQLPDAKTAGPAKVPAEPAPVDVGALDVPGMSLHEEYAGVRP